MKKYISLFLLTIGLFALNAQQKVIAHSEGEPIYHSPISAVDSIKLVNGFSNFNLSDNSHVDIPIEIIDSLTFTSGTPDPGDKIYIIYNQQEVTIINPFASQGIDITAANAAVTVNAASGISDVEYNILGNSPNGSLTIDSDKDLILRLNNLNLTNLSGPAFRINSAVQAKIELKSNTENSLTDDAAGSGNGAILTGGSLNFSGTGILNISAYKKHGISAASTIEIENGTINILTANGDAFHSEGFSMQNGSVHISPTAGDGIDAGGAAAVIQNGEIVINSEEDDVKGIKSDADITINGGSIDLTISGDQSKGISSKSDIIINNGTIAMTISGTTVLEQSGSGYDTSYATGIKADGDVVINNGDISIILPSTNMGGKGISTDGDILVNGGNLTVSTAGNGATYINESGVTDSYTSACLKSDGNTELKAGNITLSSSGKGGKGVNSDGTVVIGQSGASNESLILNVTTSGERFYVSGSGPNADYANPKAVKALGNLTVNSGTITINCTQSQEGGEGLESKNVLTINGGLIEIETYDDSINASNAIIINGGTTYCKSRGNDGIDSNGTLTVNGGFTISSGARMPEEGFDCDNNTFKITGGIIVGTGGNTSNPTASVSTQRSLKFNTTASNHFRISTSGGQEVVAFKVPAYSGGGGNNNVVVLFSDGVLANGSYILQRGGTITGGTDFHGYVTGGTYTGGSSTNFNINSMFTVIN